MEPYRLQEVRLSLVRSEQPALTVRSPQDIARAFRHLASEVRESLYAVFLNGANEAICVDRISTGNMRSTGVDPAEIIRTALLVGAVAIIIIHNHPSGTTTPSADDRQVTRTVAEAAALFNLTLIDHVIIGTRGRYYSFQNADTMPQSGRRSAGIPPAALQAPAPCPAHSLGPRPSMHQLRLAID